MNDDSTMLGELGVTGLSRFHLTVIAITTVLIVAICTAGMAHTFYMQDLEDQMKLCIQEGGSFIDGDCIKGGVQH